METVVVLRDGRRIPRGKIVEDADGKLTWETQVRESKHLFRSLDAWTLSEEVLKQLRELNIERIRFKVIDQNGVIYEVDLSDFVRNASELDQRGWKSATERQYALPRRFWRRSGRAEQLALFTEVRS